MQNLTQNGDTIVDADGDIVLTDTEIIIIIIIIIIITLCMKLSWFCHTNSGQLFCNCPRSRPLFWGNQTRCVVILLLLQND